MDLLAAVGKAGILVFLGVLITTWYGRANNKDNYKLALRKLENEEEAAAKKNDDELRDRAEKLHYEEIAFLEKRIAALETQLEKAEARAAGAESKPK